MYYIDYVGFATCSQQFWELFLVNKPVHSVHVLGQSTMKTMIDQIFSGDLAFGRSELKCFQWRLIESYLAKTKFGQYRS